jgi:hypothetical protein
VGSGNESSNSTKGGEFLGQLSNCRFLNEDYSPWSLSVTSTAMARSLHMGRNDVHFLTKRN